MLAIVALWDRIDGHRLGRHYKRTRSSPELFLLGLSGLSVGGWGGLVGDFPPQNLGASDDD